MSLLSCVQTLTVSKRDDIKNEDKFSVSSARQIVALADGASISFDSALWAEIVSRQFVDDQNLSRGWLTQALSEYRTHYDRDALSWYKQSAFDKGSFSTLAGLVLDEQAESARIFTAGDSLVCLIDGDQLVSSWPYDSAEQFDQSPLLLSTEPTQNTLLTDEWFSERWADADLSQCAAPRFLMLTDALGRWLLEEPTAERLSILLSIEDEETFNAFVTSERLSGRMRRDDTTMLVLRESA
jgi:hypothetical protein